jgi:asparagine synthase (glutamine-hydrolysing)
MAHSLETRVPFLDNDLVDFAMKVPVSLKLNHLGEVMQINENEPGPKAAIYYQRTRDGKNILRKAMQQIIPPEITAREKQGFSAPDASWFKGESINYVRRVLYNENARIYDFMHQGVVQSLIDEHLQGKQNRRLLIWSLLNFENWCKQYL